MIEDLRVSNTQKSTKVDRLKRELHESHRRARQSPKEVNRALAEWDHALAQVTAERLAAQHAKDKLEEEELARTKLQEEKARLEESLVLAQSRITFLESEAYRSEAVEEYRQGIIGKAEVALTCKSGFDYLMVQLPTEMRRTPSHFQYPPRVASCLEALEDIERQGGQLDLDAVDAEDGDDDDVDKAIVERTEDGDEGSTSQRDDGTELGSRSTPPHPTSTALPPTPRVDMDLS